jgi:hypothetical protein
MHKPEPHVPENQLEELDNEQLAAASGGQKDVFSALDALSKSKDLDALRRVDVTKLVSSAGLRLVQRPLPDFAVLMQTEYK